MTTQEIISSNLPKTQKILALAQQGLTVQQIATAIGSGYGFVWVVLKKRYPQGNTAATPAAWACDFNFTRRFGIEIEGYGVERNALLHGLRNAGIQVQDAGYTHTTTGYWKIVSDASISGTQTFELVSPILEGEAGLEDLKKVSEVLVTLRAKINKSCGTHIHFDASAMNLQTWKNLYKNYIEFEIAIDEFMPASRRASANTYCQSLLHGRVKSEIFRLIDNCRTIQSFTTLYGSRYFKINAHSYSRHNTVEFRQHSGTIEFEKMKNWILFLDGLVKFSAHAKADSGDSATMRRFCQPETLNYIHLRSQELAA